MVKMQCNTVYERVNTTLLNKYALGHIHERDERNSIKQTCMHHLTNKVNIKSYGTQCY